MTHYVRLYTQISVEIVIHDAESDIDAILKARDAVSSGDTVAFKLIDADESVTDWNIEDGDWNLLDITGD